MERLPPNVQEILTALQDGHDQVLGHSLVGLYLYGAATFEDSADAIGDIDYHVILREPFDDARRRAILGLRERLRRDYPPLGDELDGYYVALEDAQSTAPPPTQTWPLGRLPADFAWALHCAHLRAGHVIVLAGPDPREIFPEPSWPDLRAALCSEIRFVDQHLDDAPAYCVLNACRILYSFETRDVVVSKRGAGEWAKERLPDVSDSIDAALRWYSGRATPEDEAALRRAVRPVVQLIWEQTARAR